MAACDRCVILGFMRLLRPEELSTLPELGLGIGHLVARPTSTAAELEPKSCVLEPSGCPRWSPPPGHDSWRSWA